MARELNGSSSLLYTDGTPVTAPPASLVGWGYTDTLAGKRCLLNVNHENGATGMSHFSLGMNGGNDKAYFEASSGTDRTAVAAVVSTISTWQHYAGAEIAANSRAVWLDGGNKGTETTSVTFGMTPTQVVLGTWSRGANAAVQVFDRWDGRIAELAIYNEALSDAEVAVLAAGFRPLSVRPNACVGYWPCWGVHDPELDLNIAGPTRRQANLTNSPTAVVHPPIQVFSKRYWQTCAFLEPLVANMKNFSETLSLSGANVLKTVSKNLATSLSLASSITKSTGKVLSGSLDLVSSLFTTTNKLLAGTLTLGSELVKNPYKTFQQTLDLASSLPKSTTKFLSDSLSVAGSLVTFPAKILSSTLDLSSSLIKSPTKLLSDVLDVVGTFARGFHLSFTASLELSALLIKSVSRLLLGSLSLTGNTIKSIFKQIAGLLGLDGIFTKSGGTVDPDSLPPVIPDIVDFITLREDQINFIRQYSDNKNFITELTDRIDYT